MATIHDADHEYDRLVNFTDGVMAIVITLLVIEIHPPDLSSQVSAWGLATSLKPLAPQFSSFVISFLAVGLCWVAHHRIFRYIDKWDYRLLWLNLLMLLSLAVMPFSTDLLGTHSHNPTALALYSFSVALTGGMLCGIWWHAKHDRHLINSALGDDDLKQLSIKLLMVPVVFIVSAPLAFASVSVAQISWLGILILVHVAHSQEKPHEAETPPPTDRSV